MGGWKEDLDGFFKEKEAKKASEGKDVEERKSEMKAFLASKVIPAFEEVKTELEKHGRIVTISSGEDYANVTVKDSGAEEFNFSIKVNVSPVKAFPNTEEVFTDRKTGKRLSAEGSLRSGGQSYNVNDISKEEIIREVIKRYKKP